MHVPRNDGHLLRLVGFLEQFIEISHDLLKGTAHEVQRAIRENDRILFELAEILLRHDAVVQVCTLLGCSAESSGGSARSSADQRPSC